MAHSLYSINYHLKAHKRDAFIEFLKSLFLTPFILQSTPSSEKNSRADSKLRYLEILKSIELLVIEHQTSPTSSKLSRIVPSIGKFFTKLALQEAFETIELSRSVVDRRFVPPSFNDIRFLLNEAQVIEVSKDLELITFDGDMTLYADGADFAKDSHLVGLLIDLLRLGKTVAIVTAAGYPKDPKRYEQRLSGLLHGFQQSDVNHTNLERFYVFGGECNFLFRYSARTHSLIYLEQDTYQPEWMKLWSSDETRIQQLLDRAETHLRSEIESLGLKSITNVIRKSRAVGVNPVGGVTLTREQLDELALSTQYTLNSFQTPLHTPIPFCAFNGGSDVWVDVGNKLIGVKVLLEYFGTKPSQALHVGDQFLSTGNDIATRSACCTVWITSPEETQLVLTRLTSLLKAKVVK